MVAALLHDFVKKYRVTKSLFVAYCVAFTLCIYFVLLAIFGDKGLVELFVLKRKIAEKEAKKDELTSSIKTKKAMVDGMNSDSLDLDLLDEQARKVLGYVGKDEVVVYEEKNDKNTNKNSKQP